NGGMVRADGGQVLMTTQAAGSLLANAVNHTGVVQAQTLVTGENGTIKLLGGMDSGSVNVAGVLDASAPSGGNGGFVETSAAQVKVQDSARVTTAAAQGKTGNWLIDPPDFIIGAGGDIAGTTLGANLLNNNVTILSGSGTTGNNGDIHVNQAVTWTAPTTLTLDAFRDVNINQALTATNGSLVARGGRNVNVNAEIKTTTGNLALQAVNNVTIRAEATITTGDLTAVAGGSVYIDAPMTVTTGDMVLRADNDGSGPGAAAGTVSISCGANCLTITTGDLIVRFNPVTYASTSSEIGAYQLKLTGGGLLDAKAWVFGQGDNKIYDGTTIANVSGLAPDAGGVAPAATLGAVSNAHFDTKHVGTDKPITFNSSFNHAAFDLFSPAGAAPGTYFTRAGITPRPLTVSAVADTRVYNGTTGSTGTPVSLGLQAGDTLNGTLTQAYASKDVLGTGNSTLVANGPYSVSDGNGGNNYSVTVNTAPGTITPAQLVVTADDQTKTYGRNFAFAGSEFTSIGLQSSDTIATVTLTSAGAPASAHVVGSPYPIIPSAATGSFNPANYTMRYVNGAMVVTPAPLTVTASDQSKVYGTAFPFTGTEFTTSGLQNADCLCALTLTSPGSPATAPVAGNPYPIVPSAPTGTFTPSDYTIKYVNGAMTVTPAPLTVTANDATKAHGQTAVLPLSAFTSVGLKNGETISSVTQTSPGTAASAGEGPYAITPTDAAGGTFTPGNYAITYTDGTLMVTPVTPPVVTPPVVSPPVVSPPVVALPVVALPVVNLPVVTLPVDTTSVAAVVLPETPYQGPTVKPQVAVSGWMPVVVPAMTPPQLLTLAAPVSPLIVPVEKPVTEAAAIEAPPQPYMAPERPRRQDRN
ncbi:MAG: filamentous hemagglutinin N-terminal protein, partial [Polaromonas sp.]|nr:filamentous hemagglutinin N-terminal protein [Polaromonas sp.]